MALLALPILGMMGLFAWAGSLSSAGTPAGLAQEFVADLNGGNCLAAIGLIGESPMHPNPPTCRGFSDELQLTACTYTSGSHGRGIAGYRDVTIVYVNCRASSHGLTVPVALQVVTGERLSSRQVRIVDFREVIG